MKLIRKITINHCEYGVMSLPKPIFDYWAVCGATHVQIEFDGSMKVLTVSPTLFCSKIDRAPFVRNIQEAMKELE